MRDEEGDSLGRIRRLRMKELRKNREMRMEKTWGELEEEEEA